MTIYRYPIAISDNITLMLPKGAQLLTAQVQHGIPRVWALVDPTAPAEPRRLYVYGTGHPTQSGSQRYLGTMQLSGGMLVFHVFEDMGEI